MKIGFRIAGIFVDGLFKECEGLRVSLEPEEIETHFEVRLGILCAENLFRWPELGRQKSARKETVWPPSILSPA